MYLDGTTLTLVGGFDFKNGTNHGGYTYKGGDIFIDTGANSAKYGQLANGGSGVGGIVANSFGYEYVIDIGAFTSTSFSYNIVALTSSSLVNRRPRRGIFESLDLLQRWNDRRQRHRCLRPRIRRRCEPSRSLSETAATTTTTPSRSTSRRCHPSTETTSSTTPWSAKRQPHGQGHRGQCARRRLHRDAARRRVRGSRRTSPQAPRLRRFTVQTKNKGARTSVAGVLAFFGNGFLGAWIGSRPKSLVDEPPCMR